MGLIKGDARTGRRGFVFGAGALVGSVMVGNIAPVVAQSSAPDPEMGVYPVVPDVAEAWTAMFANTDGQTQFTAPVSMRFWAFAFADEEVAAANFAAVAAFYQDYLKQAAAGKSVKQSSLGKFGDDRKAYASSSDGQKLTTLVRVGSVIQVSLALAFGGTLSEDVTALLEDILPSSDKEPLDFIPTVEDLPDGWVSLSEKPIEITSEVQG